MSRESRLTTFVSPDQAPVIASCNCNYLEGSLLLPSPRCYTAALLHGISGSIDLALAFPWLWIGALALASQPSKVGF